MGFLLYIQVIVFIGQLKPPPDIDEPDIFIGQFAGAVILGVLHYIRQPPTLHPDLDIDIRLEPAFTDPMFKRILDER
jgi:hypothetical protein